MLSSIKFILKDGSVHEFSSESHGADFEVLASEFSDGNKEVSERVETCTDVVTAPTAEPVAAEAVVNPEQPEIAPEGTPKEPEPTPGEPVA